MIAYVAAPHLDPSHELPELHQSTQAFLCDLWDQVGHFKSGCGGDDFILAVLLHLENQLIALGVLLVTHIEVSRPDASGDPPKKPV